MSYAALKAIHLFTVVASAVLFLGRASAQFAGIDWRQSKLVKILPHVNDTVLLISAIWLAFVTGFTPWEQGWLAAKIAGLVIYIGLGLQALKATASPRRRLGFTLAAIAVFAYIGMVAFSKSVWPF